MTAEPHVAPSRRKRKASAADAAQLGLFDAPIEAPATPGSVSPSVNRTRALPPPPAPPPPLTPTPSAPTTQRRNRRNETRGTPRTLTIDDMPDYPPEAHGAVDRMLGDLKTEHILMTYRAIKECFGISRATVARRVKDGLVPGVRMIDGRVLEEGPVRRFDRTQVRWLLLAVRFAKRRDL